MIPARTVVAPFSASASVSFTADIFRVTWYLSLVTLFYSTCVASASIKGVRRGAPDSGFPDGHATSLSRLPYFIINHQAAPPKKRSTTEHVILCDCISASGIRSSQMAYYSAQVNGLPTGGVGTVDTGFNTTAGWYNDTTSATWADTGVTFKAVIGYHVAEDDYVGKGNNGYGEFSSTDPAYVPLESTTTTPTDDNGQTAGTSSTSTPATSSSSSNPGGNAQQPATVKKDKAISTGAVIGIAIGIVGAFTLLAGGAGFFLVRRRRIRKRQREKEQRQRKGARRESTMTGNAVHELDGCWYRRHEMGDDTGHYEIDGQVRCEMDGDGGEIKENIDDLFAEADVKEMIMLNEKADSKKVMLDDEKKEKKGYVVGVSEKEKEVRRDKEEREREWQQQHQQQQHQEQNQQLEEQKRNRDAGELPPVSPATTTSRTEEVGQTPSCLPAMMPEPEKFMAEEFRAHKEEKKKKDETNIKFRFEEETQKYMEVEVPAAGEGAADRGKDTHAHGDNSRGGQENKKEEGLP
ncbi:hypothetical protein N0V85_004067 [Neurospora sp. IMI 360204]|nr:hypothetical protein N0V85_004067 [Neurospora sp. IMI 360204]